MKSMTWSWDKNQEKEICSFLRDVNKNTSDPGEYDFLCNVRCGELCFDIVERETDPGVMKVFADLYVGGIDSGYGYSETGYPYDYMDDIGYVWDASVFKGLDLNGLKAIVEQEITKCVLGAKTARTTRGLEAVDLLEKAEMPLHIW